MLSISEPSEFTILVVDDQESNTFFIEKILNRYGYNTFPAHSGKDAIKFVEDECPDLVLLDVMMPDLSGIEVCEVLSQNHLAQNIPIILVTALVQPTDLKQGFDAGAYDYIKKPFDNIELLARVNSAIRVKENNRLRVEQEKLKTFAATIYTANYQLVQPLTHIRLSINALQRELKKEEISHEIVGKKLNILEKSSNEIIEFLEKFASIKNPELTDYVNNLKMIRF
ncbi:MAG: response regulator [Melioribacteraceae bacterium]|nr:response regulator [Melioribacteraceae bacterium]MCF8263754.1 response regulator [Melioribacteraceae bacterium]MCF8412665.1 response regulator [Melioribacteraceae bacterium]MCF8430989.1 response regulator [Melioribacteraceae bacterium]